MPDVPVRMPKMSMTMTEGEVLEWKVAPGDSVSAGDVVCEVQTDKVDMEVEAPASGILRVILVPDGVVAVGTPIAVIDSADVSAAIDLLDGFDEPPAVVAADSPPEPEPAVAPVAQAPVAQAPATAPVAQSPAPVAQAPTPTTAPAPPPSRPLTQTLGPVAAVPRARALALAAGVDLRAVTGSGAGAVITVADVEAARGTGRGVKDVRLAVARRMAGSAGVPQVRVGRDVDVEALVGAAVELVPALLAAFSAALRGSELTRCWVSEALTDPIGPAGPLGVALAVATARGTISPAFVDADAAEPTGLARAVDRAMSLARRGRVETAHLAPAVATLSFLGDHDVDRYETVVAPPQSSVLAVTRPRLLPVPGRGGLDQGIAWRRHIAVTLTVDHRVGDGALAATVLNQVAAVLATANASRAVAS